MAEPAYMRLRKHILSFAQQHNNKSVRIMPELQMCKEFGVSRVTVRNALEPLIDMGILVVKRGIGTFTNPEILEMPGNNNLVIGIIVGRGQQIHFDLFSGSILSGIFLEGPRSGARITLVHLEDGDILSKARMLARNNVDGYVWIRPNAENMLVVENLKAENIPIIVAEPMTPGNFHFVSTDWMDIGYRTSCALIERKILKTLFLGKNLYPEAFKGFLKAYEDNSIEYDNSLALDFFRNNDDWKNYLDKVDCVWSTDICLRFLISYLLKNSIMDVKVVSPNEVYMKNIPLSPFIMINNPYFEIGKCVAKRLFEIIQGKHKDNFIKDFIKAEFDVFKNIQ